MWCRLTTPLPREVQVLLDASRRLGVRVDLVHELPEYTPRPRVWEFIDCPYISSVFALQFGNMLCPEEFVPGRVVIHEERLRTWDRGYPFRLESVFLHEVAHAVVGPDEDLCTVWERDACRQLFPDRAVHRDLCRYSGSVEPDLRELRRKHRLRPGWSLRIRPRQEEQPDSAAELTTPVEAP